MARGNLEVKLSVKSSWHKQAVLHYIYTNMGHGLHVFPTRGQYFKKTRGGCWIFNKIEG